MLIDKTGLASESPPILFIVFNRPQLTDIVFKSIRQIKPSKLYIASDAARKSVPGEDRLVEQVRKIISFVDWPCNLQLLKHEENMGCKVAVSSAISWFFQVESEGIILEDDCLPHPDFYIFCKEMLKKYRDDNRIGLISGTALCDLKINKLLWNNEDYVYTRYPSVWGWATWKRVWDDYDVSILDWPNRREDILALDSSPRMAKIHKKIFDSVHNGEVDTWDYQLSYLLWSTSRLAIAPRFNLIENIGFGREATHTIIAGNALDKMSRMSVERMGPNFIAPSLLMLNQGYQKFLENFALRPVLIRIVERLLLKARFLLKIRINQ